MYDVYGNTDLCYEPSGSIAQVGFTLDSKLQVNGSVIYSDSFDSFDTEVWNTKSGVYRDWVYLPVDYTDNAFVNDNQMVIRAIKDYPTQEYDWSSAFIFTKDNIDFQYGVVNFKVKFPDTDKYHATVWLLASNGYGEIDIVEVNNGVATCNLHYYDSLGDNHIKHRICAYNIDEKEYNTFTLVWNENSISVYCNNKYIGTFDVSTANTGSGTEIYNSFKQDMYLIFNALPLSVPDETYSSDSSFDVCLKELTIYNNELNT